MAPPAQPGHARFLETRSFASLDGLRALSILGVLWHHSHQGFASVPLTRRGFLGVDLFFVVSGFLIVTLLLRESRRRGEISLRSFYARRFLRIFPPYYALLLVAGSVAYLTRGNTTEAIRHDLPFAIAYVSNFVPMGSLLYITWSLSAEQQFYVVVPALERFARGALPYLLPAMYVMACLPALGAFPSSSLPSFFRETTFAPILLGVMLAHLLDRPRSFGWTARLLHHRWAPVVAVALAVAAASYPGPDVTGWPRIAIQWTLLALVASCVVREDHLLAPLLAAWPMRRIGIVSYGIYLYHLLVMHFVVKLLSRAGASSQVAVFLGTTVGTWALAELSHRYFESRFLSLKSRFVPESLRARAAAPVVLGSPAPGGTPET